MVMYRIKNNTTSSQRMIESDIHVKRERPKTSALHLKMTVINNTLAFLILQYRIDLPNEERARLRNIHAIAKMRCQHRPRKIPITNRISHETPAKDLNLILRKVRNTTSVRPITSQSIKPLSQIAEIPHLFCVSPKVTTPAICPMTSALKSSIAR